MTSTLTQLLVLFTALVSLFSPVANIGPFAALVGHLPREDQRKIAWGVFLNSAMVLILFVWVGELIFNVLGVTPPSLSVTGGTAEQCGGEDSRTDGIERGSGCYARAAAPEPDVQGASGTD